MNSTTEIQYVGLPTISNGFHSLLWSFHIQKFERVALSVALCPILQFKELLQLSQPISSPQNLYVLHLFWTLQTSLGFTCVRSARDLYERETAEAFVPVESRESTSSLSHY